MAKGPSKATVILNEAGQRVQTAKNQVLEAEGVLAQAAAALRAHLEAYEALEKALTPKPRKKAATAPPAQAKPPTVKKEKEAAKVEGGNGVDLEPENFGSRCGVCGNGEQYQDHFQPSPNYHPFDSPAKNAGKKSKQKAAAASSTASTETSSVAAIGAGS